MMSGPPWLLSLLTHSLLPPSNPSTPHSWCVSWFWRIGPIWVKYFATFLTFWPQAHLSHSLWPSTDASTPLHRNFSRSGAPWNIGGSYYSRLSFPILQHLCTWWKYHLDTLRNISDRQASSKVTNTHPNLRICVCFLWVPEMVLSNLNWLLFKGFEQVLS